MTDCYLCGRPAIGECPRCGNPYCVAHGNRLCSRCVAPSGGLASPLLYKSTLVVLILAVVSAGWYLYRWPWSSSPSQEVPIIAAPAPTIIATESTATVATASAQTPTPTPVATAGASIQHVVEPGDSLLYIAIKYNTTVEAIVALNGLSSVHELQIGQVLLIPVTAAASTVMPTAIPAGFRTHTVQQGETMLDIALKYDTTVEAIAALNGITDPYPLQIGQVLLIPK